MSNKEGPGEVVQNKVRQVACELATEIWKTTMNLIKKVIDLVVIGSKGTRIASY